MLKSIRNPYSRLTLRVAGEKGVSTIEWIGLTAVVLVLLSAIFVYVQLHGGQVGAAAGSSMDEQVALWESGGGRVSSYSDSGLSQGGSPLGGAPGLAPPGGPAGQVLGTSTTDPGQLAQGAADTRPAWRRVWDRLWRRAFPEARAAELDEPLPDRVITTAPPSEVLREVPENCRTDDTGSILDARDWGRIDWFNPSAQYQYMLDNWSTLLAVGKSGSQLAADLYGFAHGGPLPPDVAEHARGLVFPLHDYYTNLPVKYGTMVCE